MRLKKGLEKSQKRKTRLFAGVLYNSLLNPGDLIREFLTKRLMLFDGRKADVGGLWPYHRI